MCDYCDKCDNNGCDECSDTSPTVARYVIARKDRPRRNIRKGDLVYVKSYFTYKIGGERIGYTHQYFRYQKGAAWGAECTFDAKAYRKTRKAQRAAAKTAERAKWGAIWAKMPAPSATV